MFARSTVMGIPEPPGVERATVLALTLLFYRYLYSESTDAM